MDELTPFQKEFRINDEFYSGNNIRQLIEKHFPLRDNQYNGLSCIVSQNKYHYPTNANELKQAIPDEPEEIKRLDPKFHSSFAYIVSESGHIFTPETVFRPSDLGYICDEIKRD